MTIWIQFEIARPVAAIKSFRFALFFILMLQCDDFPMDIHASDRLKCDNLSECLMAYFPRMWLMNRAQVAYRGILLSNITIKSPVLSSSSFLLL